MTDGRAGGVVGRRALTAWLAIIGSVFLMLFACGQFALVVNPPDTSSLGANSSLAADYSAWRPAAFAALDPRIILAALRDFGLAGLPLQTGDGTNCLLGASCPQSSPTRTPTSTGFPTATLQAPTVTQAALVPPAAGDTDQPPTARRSTSTATPLPTSTPVTPTDTDTPVPTATAVPPTPSNTPRPPTPTRTPCPGNCEPDVGTPDGAYAVLAPGTEMVFSLTSPIVVDGDPDYDLVYYERLYGATILLDLVVVRIGQTSTGAWYVVFDWGDGLPDTNSSVGGYGADGTEEPNAPIDPDDLYGTSFDTGIGIDVDHAPTPVPTGEYDVVSVAAPTPSAGTTPAVDQQAEVDAVEILPTSGP